MELLDQGLYQPLVKIRDTASGEKYLLPLRPLLDLRVQYNEVLLSSFSLESGSISQQLILTT